jgi:hypothetical protein
MWSVKEKKLTNMTANEAWDAYQRGALQNFKSVSRTPISNSGGKNTSAVQSFISRYMTREQAAQRGITEKEWTAMIMNGLHNVNLTADEFEQLEKHYQLRT